MRLSQGSNSSRGVAVWGVVVASPIVQGVRDVFGLCG